MPFRGSQNEIASGPLILGAKGEDWSGSSVREIVSALAGYYGAKGTTESFAMARNRILPLFCPYKLADLSVARSHGVLRTFVGISPTELGRLAGDGQKFRYAPIP